MRQIGHIQTTSSQRVSRLAVKLLSENARAIISQILWVNTGLGGHQRHFQIHAALSQRLMYVFNDRELASNTILGVRKSGKLLFGVEPALLANDNTAAALSKSQILDRGPEVDAQRLDRKRLVVV